MKAALAGSAQVLLTGVRKPAWASAPNVVRQTGRRVAVLGGGVAGLSAAHELAERGFDVAVYEARSTAGGKARSIFVPGTGVELRKDLPGEHGFRFFPGFYKHLPDTMSRIPFAGNARGVFDNLVAADRIHISLAGRPDIIPPSRIPTVDIDDFKALLVALLGPKPGLTQEELAFFHKKLVMFAGSCDERRFGELEKISWWKYVEAERFSENYRKLLATGLTRNLVAARAEEISARTCGTILLQLLWNVLGYGESVDRVLNGPTTEVWIAPWLAHLRSLGVRYHVDSPVERLHFDGRALTGFVVNEAGRRRFIEADHYVLAVPCERVPALIDDEMTLADPRLGRIRRLRTEWMCGMQFFLDRDVPIVNGHTNYYDSPWALTSISQPQFWKGVDLSRYGDGAVRGVLSVDISNWNAPGIVYGKPALECSPEQIRDEVWAQIRAHLDGPRLRELDEARVLNWFIGSRPAPLGDGSKPASLEGEPLLINTVGSWQDRPEAETRIPNLFLAGDYVRTNTDLACMEAANEAARRAVNGILKAVRTDERPCRIWPLAEPAIFRPAKTIDRMRYKTSGAGASQHQPRQLLQKQLPR